MRPSRKECPRVGFTTPRRPAIGSSAWLSDVREVRLPIDLNRPLSIHDRREFHERELPRPSVPYPERHPYCELNFMMQGRGEQFIGSEQARRKAGDLMLIGPDIPHYGTFLEPDIRVIVVHFLPILLIEMSPNGDGARLLSRFTGSSTIAQRIVQPPRELRERLAAHFEEMAREFATRMFGSELVVRARLMDVLIGLSRWEESIGRALPQSSDASGWPQVEKALQFIGRHYAEPLYVDDIAAHVGLGPARLHAVFRDTFGMSCLQYLRAYRISHATALLSLSHTRVAEVAFAVGFESLSQFNASFRHFQGLSPREYTRRQRKMTSG
jgi:AraC-like DNA-binding protein